MSQTPTIIEDPVIPCHWHPRKEAVGVCPTCDQPVCDVCETSLRGKFLCRACARKSRRRRMILLVSAGVVLLAGIAVLTGYLLTRETIDYGKYEGKIHKVSRRLERDPCDRVKMHKLADLLFTVGDHRRLVERSRRFVQECGPFPRLLWFTHESHKRLGQYDRAIADASALIEEYPYDKDFRWWRGEAYERKRDYLQALENYRQSLALQPGLERIPIAMARVAKRAGKRCEGIFPIEQLVFKHPHHGDVVDLVHRLTKLYNDPACAGMAGEGSARLPLGPDPGQAGVEVHVNDKGPGNFVLDLDASYTLVSKSFAERVGLAPRGELLIWDASEVRRSQRTRLDRVEIQEASAGKVEAVIVDKLPPGVDGVVGISLLGRFAVVMVEGGDALELLSKL